MCRSRLFELHADCPIFLRHKCLDFLFTVADELHGHRLHASGRKPLLDLAPEKRAELVADNAVEHTPRLLGIHTVDIDRMRLPHSRLYGRFRYFIKNDAAILLGIHSQDIGQMPGDCLSFAVGIGGQIYLVGMFCVLFQRLDQIPFAADIDVLGGKIMLDVDAELAFGQIAQMSHGGAHHILLAKIFLDGLGLGRRLDDNQCRWRCSLSCFLARLLLRCWQNRPSSKLS